MSATAEIWIDHRRAVITTVSAEGQTTLEVWAHPGSPPEGFLNPLNQYYAEVIAAIGDAFSILIFGPGEAKLELGRRLGSGHAVARIHTMDANGRMTERQIADRARDHLYT